MSDIPPINLTTKAPGAANANGVHARLANGRPATPDDTVEISELGQRLSAIGDPDIRLDKVQAIRLAIAEGTYETPDKLEATIDRVVDVLRQADQEESDAGSDGEEIL